MFIRLPRWAVAIALAFSIGLHWGFLQSVAWVEMVVSYSQEGGVGQALTKTFDGQHPCCLCKAIAQARHSEKKSEFQLKVQKFEFLSVQAQFVFAAPTAFWHLGATTDSLNSVLRCPPTPPPRAVAV